MDEIAAAHRPESRYRERHARLCQTNAAFEAAVSTVIGHVRELADLAAGVDKERQAVLAEALRLIESGVRVPRPASLGHPAASIAGAARKGPNAAIAAITVGAKIGA